VFKVIENADIRQTTYNLLSVCPGADLRQKASSATLPERPPLLSLLLPPLPCHPLSSSLPFPPLEVGPSKLNPATGYGGAL